MRILRNLVRRKLRTSLTVMGVTIGIWALVIFGSMANRITAMVDNGAAYFDSGVVAVWGGGGSAPQSNPLDIAVGDRIAEIPGVDAVIPSIQLDLTEEPTMTMSLPPMITAEPAGADRGRSTMQIEPAEGRLLTPEDEGANVTVLGSDIALQYGKHAGDTFTMRGQDFLVVGVLRQTLTQPDIAAMVPLSTGQRLYVSTLPSLIRGDLDPSRVVTGFAVYPEPGADPNVIAAAIEAMNPELGTMGPDDFDRLAGTYADMLNAVLVGIGLISVVIGGLSTVNTMAMSVAERTREIGIKRAIGASRLRIVREFVTESAVIGLIGGSIGLGLGWLVVMLANEAGRSSGTILFEMTVGTALTAIAFSTLLGALAGFVPAVHAARLDPVAALRYE